MWTIKDMVVGETTTTKTKARAVAIAKAKLSYHNNQFNYSHRGKHYNAHAIYTIDEEKHEITIKGG